MKGFTWIRVFLPSFIAEVGKAEVTKRVRTAWYSLRKKVGILSLSLGLLDRSRQKFYRINLSLFPSPRPSFVQIRPVFEEIYPKMSSDSLQHRRDADN